MLLLRQRRLCYRTRLHKQAELLKQRRGLVATTSCHFVSVKQVTRNPQIHPRMRSKAMPFNSSHPTLSRTVMIISWSSCEPASAFSTLISANAFKTTPESCCSAFKSVLLLSETNFKRGPDLVR